MICIWRQIRNFEKKKRFEMGKNKLTKVANIAI